MGQYYRQVIIDDDNNVIATRNSWSMDYGAKLLEHSYFNKFVQCAVDYLRNHPNSRLVWAGDYADEIKKDRNLYTLAAIAEDEKNCEIIPEATEIKQGYYILNNDKKVAFLYKDLTDEHPDAEDWYFNPLPILTCEGNGRGGGDYYNTNDKRVGSWRGDHLSVADELPEGYTLVDYIFNEDYENYNPSY